MDATTEGLDLFIKRRSPAFASHRGDHESSQVPVVLLLTCPALRPRRTACTTPATVQPMLPSVQKTTSAPHSLSFRGSITRPASPLCTLRSRGRPRTTQHSVPVGGYPLPGQDLHLRVLTEGFDMSFLHIPSSFSRLHLAHFPRKRALSAGRNPTHTTDWGQSSHEASGRVGGRTRLAAPPFAARPGARA
jgi:hypothetical protein